MERLLPSPERNRLLSMFENTSGLLVLPDLAEEPDSVLICTRALGAKHAPAPSKFDLLIAQEEETEQSLQPPQEPGQPELDPCVDVPGEAPMANGPALCSPMMF